MAIRLLSSETIDGNITVSGTAVVGNTLYLAEYIQHTGNTNNNIRFQTNRMQLFANFGTAGYIDLHDNGNVYIGASNATALTITSSSATFAGNVTVGNNGNINIPTAASGNANLNFDGTDFKITSNSSSANLKLETNSTTRLTINSSGNATFAGDVHAGGRLRSDVGSDSGTQLNLWADSNGSTFLAGYNFAIYTGNNNARTQSFIIDHLKAATFAGSVHIDTKANSGLAYNVLIDIGSNGDGTIGYQTSTQLVDNLTGGYNGLTFADGTEALNTAAGCVIATPSRSSSPDPEDYQRSFSTEFKGKTASGSPGTGSSWIGLVSMSPYRPQVSGFYTTQLGFGADGTNGDMFIRRGTTTSWGDWRKFIISDSSGNTTFGGTITAGDGTQAINADADLTLRNGNSFVGIDLKSARTSGNIGGLRYYGTASDSVPVAQFLVETDGQLKYYNGTNGAQSRFIVNSSGNVGIGISPVSGARLTLGTGAVANEILSFAPASGGNAELRNTSSTGTFTFTNADGSSEKMRITSAGNVGIGTTSPAYKLDVNGTGYYSDLLRVDEPVYSYTNSGTKHYTHLATGSLYGSGASAAIITTNIPGHNISGNGNMFSFKIVGYAYTMGIIDMTVGLYAGENNFYSAYWSGTCQDNWIGNVYVFTNSAGATCIQLGEVTDVLNCEIAVTDFVQGFGNVNANYSKGWSIAAVTTLPTQNQKTTLNYKTILPDVYEDVTFHDNVGIGTTSPSYPLDINGNMAIRGASGPQLLFFETGSSYTEAMRLLRYQDKLILTYGWNANEEAITIVGGTGSDVGNVGIGNTSPQTTLHTGPTTTVTNAFTARFAASNFFASGGNSMFYVPDAAANIMMFGSNQFGTNQIEFYHKNPGTSQAYVGRISTSGSATSYVTSSDYRLKENIVPISESISRLNQLKPSRFNFIEEPGKVVDGFIAHEVQDIVPEAIVGEKDEVDEEGGIVPQGIDQAKLVPLLVAAVQELEARVKELENK